ncbi:MAG: aspartate aminotransferase family protein [Haliea sp.]|nr:aspartate aminotransferase family protein [Haliea sp.]
MKETSSNAGYYRPDHYLKYPIVFKSADGTTVKDVNGREYLDLSAIMGAVNCGHNVPQINSRLIQQIGMMWTSNFFPTDIQLEAIAKVDSILPEGINLAALYSTGAEAIELALRVARAATGRNRILSFKDHFHGKTLGTMHLVKQFPDCYGPVPDDYRTVFESDGSDDPAILEAYLASIPVDDLAAVIFEPVIGYSGPRRLHKDFLGIMRKFCDENDVVMIVDEILTGFHRCKGWFVSCQGAIKPDILVFGKGLGNGHPISGVACASSLYQFLGNSLPGSTFAGNSLACAAACGVLEFMHGQNFAEKTTAMETLFCEFFSQPRFKAHGIRLDGMGGLLSISFQDPSFSRMPDIYLDVLKNGVITSHTQQYLRLTPPLTIDLIAFERGLEVIGKCIDASFATAIK